MSSDRDKPLAQEPEAEAPPANKPAISGPSLGNATNLAFAEVVMRSVGHLMQKSVGEEISRKAGDPKSVREMLADRSLLSALAIYGASRLATRSVPGALAVAGGLLIKTLYDRGTARQQREREKQRQIGAPPPEN